MEKQAIHRLKREFVLLQNIQQPNFRALPSDTDILTWHYVVFDLPPESPYSGGQYHGKLIFPREYPLKPPSILMCTISGRFEINKRLCLSMSDYHPETWNPSWRVETILLGLVSFMLDESDPATTGGIRTSFGQRRADALLSFFRNSRNNEFKVHFPDMLDHAKYFVGSGFSYKSLSGDIARSLKDLGMESEEIVSIFSLDDLERMLDGKGVPRSHAPRLHLFDKSLRDIAPWLLVGTLVLFWLTTNR